MKYSKKRNIQRFTVRDGLGYCSYSSYPAFVIVLLLKTLISDVIIDVETEIELWLYGYFELTEEEIKIERAIKIIHKIMNLEMDDHSINKTIDSRYTFSDRLCFVCLMV